MRIAVAIHTILAQGVLTKALPNPLPNLTGTAFSVDLIKRHFPDALQGHEKRAGSTQASTGVTNLTSHQDKWTIDVVVGGQTLPVVLDTGSTNFWLESNMEPSSMTHSGQPLYTPTATTNSIPGVSWTASFDAGQTVAQGVAYYDTLAIGAATVTRQVVGAATSVASVNTERKAGIIGLTTGRTQFQNATSGQPSVMANLQDQLGITQFALDLRYDNASRLDFGFIDPSRYTGSITYANRDTHYVNWNLVLDNVYYINNVRQTGNMSNTNLTMVDSGAPNMNFPPAIVQNYYRSVTNSSQDNNGVYYFPCSLIKTGQLPSFSVSVSGVAFTVPGVWMWSFQSGSICYGSLQSSGGSYSVLGDMFLRTVFAVFDTKGSGRIGFATKALPTRNGPS